MGVSPSSFNANKKSQSPSRPPKGSKKRKARQEAEQCPEVKVELCQYTKAEDSSKQTETESGDNTADTLYCSSADTQTETAEQKRFVCSTCGEDFVNMMSLNLHRNSCVPDELYDEFPSDIIDNGERNGKRNKFPAAQNINVSSTNIFSMAKDEAVNCDSPRELSSEDDSTSTSTCFQGLASANSCERDDNPHDEIQHSKKTFNGGDERQETVENGERETNGKLEDESVLRAGKVNNVCARSGPELHSCPPVIDRSGAEALAKTDTSQIINTGVGGQHVLNNGHFSTERKEKEENKENIFS